VCPSVKIAEGGASVTLVSTGGGGLIVNVAELCKPPARARISVLPSETALAMVVAPVFGKIVALFVFVESHKKETLRISASAPLRLA
jgi:hypothetical protein